MPFSQSGPSSRNEPSFTDPETILPQDITEYKARSFYPQFLNVNFQPKLNIRMRGPPI
jgi:hypothetical protein